MLSDKVDWKTRLELYKREAYLLARSDMPHGDHPAGTGVLDATFRAIEAMVELELAKLSDKPKQAESPRECAGVHCRCLNLDKKCPRWHNGDHNCPNTRQLVKDRDTRYVMGISESPVGITPAYLRENA